VEALLARSCKQPYDESFYAEHQTGSYESAKHVAEIVIPVTKCRSIVDLGCGCGTWLRAFTELGIRDILGVDGEYVRPDMLQIPADRFVAHDLSQPLSLGRRFDLACGLEVAEHLPCDRAATYVESLTTHAPIVLFSGAIPGQGGTGHINERWQDSWAELFEKQGYTTIDFIRERIWLDPCVAWWYAQNLLMFVEKARLESDEVLSDLASSIRPMPLRIVHPSLYQWYVARNRTRNELSLSEIMRAAPAAAAAAIRLRVRRATRRGRR
jgi:hypothetical protein